MQEFFIVNRANAKDWHYIGCHASWDAASHYANAHFKPCWSRDWGLTTVQPA